MTTYSALPNLGIGVGVLRLASGLDSAARRTVDWISRRLRRHTTIVTFEALSDHLLDDIGLNRFQIGSTVDAFGSRALPGDRTAARFVRERQSRS